MRIIRNPWLPPKNYTAINLFGILFCRPDAKITADVIRHEQIHTCQMVEMGILLFYLWYVIEWFIRCFLPGNAYMNISFEREAYQYMFDKNYLHYRKSFAWWKFLNSSQKLTK